MQRHHHRKERPCWKVSFEHIQFFIYRLALELLKKETLSLPDIVDILGQRPYPLKETVAEYLKELRQRKDTEEDTTVKTEGAEEKTTEDK